MTPPPRVTRSPTTQPIPIRSDSFSVAAERARDILNDMEAHT
jgi:hypothetical protein